MPVACGSKLCISNPISFTAHLKAPTGNFGWGFLL